VPGPEYFHFPGVAAPVALQRLDGGGLPRAVRAEERKDLTRADGQIDPAHGLDVPVQFPQPADPDRSTALTGATRHV
jgi:hypothetical protein